MNELPSVLDAMFPLYGSLGRDKHGTAGVRRQQTGRDVFGHGEDRRGSTFRGLPGYD
jgi:hypothetical protein